VTAWLRQNGSSRTALIVMAPAVLLIAIAWTFLSAQIAYELRGAIADTHRANANLVLALEQHTVRTIGSVDLLLRFLRRDYARYGSVDIGGAVGEGRVDHEVIINAVITDELGNVVMKVGEAGAGNIGETPHFRYLREHQSDELYIGRPVRGKLSGRMVIPVSRRIEIPGGGFAGVVAAALNPDYFGRFYAQADLGKGGMVLLVGLDGVTRARSVGNGDSGNNLGSASSAGQEMRGSTLLREQQLAPNGSFVSAGRVEGVRRFISYRTVTEYGLVVAVGQSEAEALAPYQERKRFYLWSGGVFTALVALVSALIFIGMRRRRQLMEEQLRTEARFRATFDQAAVGMAHVGLDGRLLKVNARLCEVTGYAEHEVVGREFLDFKFEHERAAADREHKAMLGGGRFPMSERRYRRKDGSVLWANVAVSLVPDPRGRPDYFVVVVQDITAQKLAQEKVQHQATHDLLTDLPNRSLFHDRMEQAMRQARRQGWTAGVLFMDLDHFKHVNDSLGHAAGDALLREVANRLAGVVRESDTAARVGGDEFAVVLGQLANAGDARIVAEKVVKAMAVPMSLDGHDYVVTVSIGITLFPRDGEDVETLLRNADAAMFRAKEAGRNCFRFHGAAQEAQAA
jgi:diguanylate cyclase (GGDEF)-like protein/PAS domain S-box-containing protein